MRAPPTSGAHPYSCIARLLDPVKTVIKISGCHIVHEDVQRGALEKLFPQEIPAENSGEVLEDANFASC